MEIMNKIICILVSAIILSFLTQADLSAESLLQTFVEEDSVAPINDKLFLHILGDSFGQGTNLEGTITAENIISSDLDEPKKGSFNQGNERCRIDGFAKNSKRDRPAEWLIEEISSYHCLIQISL